MKSTTMHTRFAHIWNEIVDTMRDEDILSNRERMQLRYFLIQLRLPTADANARTSNFAPEAQVLVLWSLGMPRAPPHTKYTFNLVAFGAVTRKIESVNCKFCPGFWIWQTGRCEMRHTLNVGTSPVAAAVQLRLLHDDICCFAALRRSCFW